MDKLRIKLTFSCHQLKVPLNYNHLIQGLIYGIFDQEKEGQFIHDKGYRLENKIFKMFVFSNLFGDYEIVDKHMVFKEKVSFYISSFSNEFIEIIYKFFLQNEKVIINHQILSIQKIQFIKLPYFKGEKECIIQTLSSIVAYRTEDNYVTYFKPSDLEFEQFCLNNLKEKSTVLYENDDFIYFECKEVLNEKRRLVKFKNTFYVSYITTLKIKVNYETLSLLYDTGISSKGPAGFGMIELIE